MLRRIALAFSLFLLCSCGHASDQPTAAAPDVAAQLVQQANTLVRGQMKKENIAGLSLTLVVDKKIVVSQAYGMADVENHAPASPATRFRTGSVAKPIAAAAAMALYQAGKLDLDAPVQKYCPAFPAKQWTITTRELLGHLAGIRHYREDDSDVFSAKHYARISDGFEMFAADPLLFEPGSKMNYSTYGYNVVGCVIEGASGEEFMQAVRELVLVPSGMTATRTDDVFEIIDDRSRPYTVDKDHKLHNATFVDTSNKVPGGGIISTSDDLARFAIAMESDKFLTPQTTALMWTSQQTTDGKPTGYGYGWGVGTEDGTQLVAHTGGQPGASSVLLLLPSRGFAVAIMANTDEVEVADIAKALAHSYLKSVAARP